MHPLILYTPVSMTYEYLVRLPCFASIPVASSRVALSFKIQTFRIPSKIYPPTSYLIPHAIVNCGASSAFRIDEVIQCINSHLQWWLHPFLLLPLLSWYSVPPRIHNSCILPYRLRFLGNERPPMIRFATTCSIGCSGTTSVMFHF